MDKRNCTTNPDACRQENGNCLYPGSDGLPVQCVGPWVAEKYHYLNNILEATSPVRRQFFPRGNSVFIDLFSGPGKCIIKDEQCELDSVCINTNIESFLFNSSILIDIDENNTAALRARLGNPDYCTIIAGDSNEKIPIIVNELLKKKWRYHFAYIDPFGCENLKFHTIQDLAKLERMDLFINFPIGSIKRNIGRWMEMDSDTPLDLFLGTKQWREEIRKVNPEKLYDYLSNLYKDQLVDLGYPLKRLNVVPVKNKKNVTLYVIIYAAKRDIGQKIWNSILKIRFGGQKELF